MICSHNRTTKTLTRYTQQTTCGVRAVASRGIALVNHLLYYIRIFRIISATRNNTLWKIAARALSGTYRFTLLDFAVVLYTFFFSFALHYLYLLWPLRNPLVYVNHPETCGVYSIVYTVYQSKRSGMGARDSEAMTARNSLILAMARNHRVCVCLYVFLWVRISPQLKLTSCAVRLFWCACCGCGVLYGIRGRVVQGRTAGEISVHFIRDRASSLGRCFRPLCDGFSLGSRVVSTNVNSITVLFHRNVLPIWYFQ